MTLTLTLSSQTQGWASMCVCVCVWVGMLLCLHTSNFGIPQIISISAWSAVLTHSLPQQRFPFFSVHYPSGSHFI